MATLTLSEKLESARALIFNSRNPDVSTFLENWGIDTAYLDLGEKLYRETMESVDAQKKEYQEERAIYDEFYVQKDNVLEDFRITRNLCKTLTKVDKDLRNRLLLHLAIPYRVEEWINYGIAFYNALLQETAFMTRLERYKVSRETLVTEKEAMENLRSLRNQSLVEKGQAQEATRLRNEKLEELEEYCAELKGIARIALGKRPQLMESLGILVRS